MSRVVGVVTVTYNSSGVLDDFLESLWRQGNVEVRLYAVDNDSRDDSVLKLRSDASLHATTVIANDTNTGVSVGNNQGIEAAVADGCDWILLLNNDTLFEPNFISGLVEVAEEHDLSILSPLIAATNPPGSNWYSDGVIRPFRANQAKHLGMGKPLRQDRPTTYSVNYASTCALLVAPAVFERVGLMDPIYFVYGDDVDFCIRARKAGLTYNVANDVVLTHKASSLTGEFTGPFAVRWVSRNWVVVARRHCSPLQLAVGLIFIALWTAGRLVLCREPGRVTRARLRAYREGLLLDLSTTPPRLTSRKGRPPRGEEFSS